MATKLTSLDVTEITTQSDLISKSVRDNYTALKVKLNEVIDELLAAQIGTTNAETTAARPYHTSLKERLDSQWDNQANYIKSGGLIEEQSTADMTVQVDAGEATVDGVDAKWSAQSSGTITAPTTNNRFDVVVINSDSTLSVVIGSESATPVYPNVTQLQKAIAVITLTPSTTTITDSIITDARDMGAWYKLSGVMAYKWLIQDAIDDLTSGNIHVGMGTYQEDLTYASNQTIIFDGGATLKDSSGSTVDFGDVDLSSKTACKIIWAGGENHSDDIEIDGETTFNDEIYGDVTGNLTGDVTGDLTGDVTGDLNGTADDAWDWNHFGATSVGTTDGSSTQTINPLSDSGPTKIFGVYAKAESGSNTYDYTAGSVVRTWEPLGGTQSLVIYWGYTPPSGAEIFMVGTSQ